jgi:hypothetical protein
MFITGGNYAASPPIVNKGINSFLQHAFLISDNYLRCTQPHKAAETVVPINNSPVEVVKVANNKATTI